MAARDALLERWDNIDRKGQEAKNMLALRNEYLAIPENHAAKAGLEEIIEDKAEDIAQQLGVLEKMKSRPEELTSEETGKVEQVKRAYKIGVGKLTLFEHFVPDWLETIENRKTRSDYRRAFELLQKEYVAVEELNWEKCKTFLRDRIRKDKKARPTVQKWNGAYIKFWDYLDLDTALWRNHTLPETEELDVQPFTRAEVRAMCDRLKQDGDWLYHAVWIAAHTGARAGAIVGLKYNRDDETIWLPKKKKEKKDRIIPAHSAIRSSLEYWENNRRAVQTISNRFKDFKRERGFGEQYRFHSLRHTVATELENVECPEVVAMDITGHKKKTTTYGIYSGGSSIELMRGYLEKIRY